VADIFAALPRGLALPAGLAAANVELLHAAHASHQHDDHASGGRAHGGPGAPGTVAVDGVSLTINEVGDTVFGVNIIPHTQAVTTLGKLAVDSRVNLEVDQVARYLASLLPPSLQR